MNRIVDLLQLRSGRLHDPEIAMLPVGRHGRETDLRVEGRDARQRFGLEAQCPRQFLIV